MPDKPSRYNPNFFRVHLSVASAEGSHVLRAERLSREPQRRGLDDRAVEGRTRKKFELNRELYPVLRGRRWRRRQLKERWSKIILRVRSKRKESATQSTGLSLAICGG